MKIGFWPKSSDLKILPRSAGRVWCAMRRGVASGAGSSPIAGRPNRAAAGHGSLTAKLRAVNSAGRGEGVHSPAVCDNLGG
jgi:hypothetical protein